MIASWHYFRWFPIVGILLLLAGIGYPPAVAHGQGHLYVVIATDDNDSIVGPHVAQDGMAISGMLHMNVTADEYSLTKIDADDMRPDKILETIGAQPVGTEDALFFYYSGHGAYRGDIGQFFWLSGPRSALPRANVRNAVRGKNPRLGVIITDCCYSYFEDTSGVAPRAVIAETKPLFDELFFKRDGFVDLTSSKVGQISTCYPQAHRGSIFTSSLAEVMWNNQDQRLSWRNVFEQTRDRTAAEFQNVHPNGAKVKTVNGVVRQFTQTAWAFALEPDGVRFGATVQDTGGQGAEIVELVENAPAKNAGLEIGDVILRVNGRRTDTVQDFVIIMDESEPDITLEVRDVNTGNSVNVAAQLRY